MSEKISFFEKNLTIWVILCMITGVLISVFLPIIPETLNKFEYYNVSIPIAILIFIMIYPMMLKVDFSSIRNIRKNPQGLYLTWIVNWVIKPVSMLIIATIFFDYIYSFISDTDVDSLVAGAVLLGAAPCTAMVFVWSKLVKGDSNYTVVQVATNDLLILILFIPIVGFLLGVSDISIPYSTLFLSIFLFVVIPITAGVLSKHFITRFKGKEYFENVFIKKFDKSTIIGLLLTLILIFSFQGQVILSDPVLIILIAIPLIIQTVIIFIITFLIAKKMKLSNAIAGPCSMIATSNFFELAVAISITTFGISSLATLVTIVGVLVEVPLMLMLVKFVNYQNKKNRT